MTPDELKSELMRDNAFCHKLKVHLLKDVKFEDIFYEPFFMNLLPNVILLKILCFTMKDIQRILFYNTI